MKCFLCIRGEIYSQNVLHKIKKIKKIIIKDKAIESENFKKRYSYLLKKLGGIDSEIILINLLIKQERNYKKESK